MDEKRIRVKIQAAIPVNIEVEVSFEGEGEEIEMTIHGGDLPMMGQPRITERFLGEHLSEDIYAHLEEVARSAWQKK